MNNSDMRSARVDNVKDNECSNNFSLDTQSKYVQLDRGSVPKFHTKGIKFGHINVRSLIGKIDEFRHLCGDVFDVICVNETNCDNTIGDSELHLPGFNLLRCDRNRNGGGVALYINENFNFARRDDLSDDNDIECIWVEIAPPCRRKMYICALYNPNGKDFEFSSKLSVMLSKVSIGDNEIVLLGDFNCDFTPNVSAKEVNDLKFVGNMHQLQQLIDLPTRVTDHSATIIDLFFTSKPELYSDSGVIQTALSDHFMIYAIRKGKLIKGDHKTIDYRCYKNFDENVFLADLFNVPWYTIENCVDVNEAVDVWNHLFNQVVDKHIPKKVKRVRATPSPWLNRDITQHMSTRDFLHRKAIRSGRTSDWDAYKTYRNKVTAMVRKSKEAHFKNNIEQGVGNPNKLWKTLNDILPSKVSKNPSSIVVDGKVLSKSDDMSNGFNDYFANVANNLINQTDNGAANTDSRNPPINTGVSKQKLDLPYVSIDFISKEILNMDVKKATGFDDISCKLLKLARPAIVESLTYIINLSLHTGIFPNAWKVAKVVPLHKGGDLNSTNNYRPISILSCVSKIIEKAVHKHVYSFLSINNIINQHQSGFRPFHSTETALTDMIDDLLSNMNSGKMTGLAFIDLRKAFDTVSHDLLLEKLHGIGADDMAIKWFRSYLTGRTQRVSFKGSVSDSLPVNTGVPQGSILGPLLFIVFINDMCNVIQHGNISMYADDTTLFVSGNDAAVISYKLQQDLEAIMLWLHQNKLFLNTDKTKIMLVGTSVKLNKVQDGEFFVSVNGRPLENVECMKCLGVVIDKELKWHKHVNSVIQKVCCKAALLRRVKPYLNVSTLNMLYKALVQPHFDYCGIAWYGRFKDDCNKLDVLQKRCARIILGVDFLTPSADMFNDLKWEQLSVRYQYFRALMVFKCLNNLAPQYLADKFQYISDIHQCNTRQAAVGNLALPPLRNGHDIEGYKHSFTFSGVKVWNTINPLIRNSANINGFKKLYKSEYFKQL